MARALPLPSTNEKGVSIMTKPTLRVIIAAAAITLGAAYAQTNAPSCCASKSTSQNSAPVSPNAGHAEHTAPEGEADHAMPSCCSGKGKAGMAGGMQGRGGMGAVMPDAMQLLHNHASLERKVEEIPDGVKTTTTTRDPEILALLRKHPREMYNHYESGGVVRPHDPMFGELARVADKVKMEFRDIENGIETIATSDDPEVVKLIRAHAQKVSEFVKRGMSALHEGAPLPEDYHPAK